MSLSNNNYKSFGNIWPDFGDWITTYMAIKEIDYFIYYTANQQSEKSLKVEIAQRFLDIMYNNKPFYK